VYVINNTVTTIHAGMKNMFDGEIFKSAIKLKVPKTNHIKGMFHDVNFLD